MEIESEWLGNGPEYIYKSFWSSEQSQKFDVWDPKVIFQFFGALNFSFHQKLNFWVSILKICLVEYVHMDRTDNLRFR